MGALRVNNDARSWGDFLLSLADEAAKDAFNTADHLALHGVLDDLSRVAEAYAGRLGVERGSTPVQEVTGDTPVAAARESLDIPEDYRRRLEAVEEGLNEAVHHALLQPQQKPVSELPDWLARAFENISDRITAVDARVAMLEERVRELEDREPLQTVTVTPSYQIIDDPASGPIDDDPNAWDNIERARNGLRAIVVREHRQRAKLRQTFLERVTALAKAVDITDDERAELRQHEVRVKELGRIDGVAASMIEGVAALDDLDQARAYAGVIRSKEAWP